MVVTLEFKGGVFTSSIGVKNLDLATRLEFNKCLKFFEFHERFVLLHEVDLYFVHIIIYKGNEIVLIPNTKWKRPINIRADDIQFVIGMKEGVLVLFTMYTGFTEINLPSH